MDRNPHKVLANAEKEKKRKYDVACRDARKDFTPLIFSADGLMADKAKAAVKRLATILVGKWDREYSVMCGYIRSRLAITLARSMSHCIRGSRNPVLKHRSPEFGDGAGLRLYR